MYVCSLFICFVVLHYKENVKICFRCSDSNGLLIDHLVSKVDSNGVNRLWSTEFGGNGHYPPPSLYVSQVKLREQFMLTCDLCNC